MAGRRWRAANALSGARLLQGEAVRQGDERTAMRTRISLNRRFHLGHVTNRSGICRHAEGRGRGLDEAQVMMSIWSGLGIEEKCDPPRSGSNLLEHFEPLPGERILIGGEPGGIAAGPRVACQVPTGSDRFANTIGMARVSSSRASTAGVLAANSTSGLRLTNSLAMSRIRSGSPAGQR